MGVEDLDLNRDDASPPQPKPVRDDARMKWIVAGVVGLALVGGALARWWTLDRQAVQPAPRAAPAASTEVALAPAATLPPLDQTDGYVRTLLGTLSSRPELMKWLATDNLIRQMALVIDRVARGGAPGQDLKVLSPATPFETTRRGTGRRATVVVKESSYTRYDGIAETIATLDAAAVARGYETLKPRLNEAYRAMGREGDVDLALRMALEVLISTPIPTGPITLVEGKGAAWAYTDPALEALNPAQKQLLRLGPANASRIIEKLKDVRERLHLPQ
jgi:hypothetical protein